MEPVSGQDDRERERHARDGVWLPAGEGQPAARGLPGSRHTPRPGIAKGEAFSPLARRRSPQVDRSPASARRNRISVWPPHRQFMIAGWCEVSPAAAPSGGRGSGSAAVPLPYSGSSRA